MKVISGQWQYPDGTPAAGASVWFKLPQDCTVLGTAQICPQWVRKILDSTGSLPAGTLIFFTDEITPTGLTYTISVVAPGGGLIWGAESVSITGNSFNLNLAVPTTLSVLLSNPVVTNPTGIQTINSFALADTVGFQAGFGAVSVPSYSFIGDLNTGMYDAATGDIRFSVSGTDSFRIDGTAPTIPSGRPLAWGSAGVTSRDAGISRLGASSLAVGNGTQADISGSFTANLFRSVQGLQQQSATSSFSIIDNLGVAHLFIAGTSPFTNTFIQGNGSGTTFIGTGNFAVNIPDANNLIQFKGLTSGTINLVPSAIAGSNTLTLPARTGVLAVGNISSQNFVANGTFTIPAGVTATKVTVIGGGGAGGGATVTINGSGGGSGAYAVKYLSGLTSGNTIAVTVGAGGTGVSAAGGNNGSSSLIASGTQTITTVTAPGGGGGLATAASSAGGQGASIATNGDINSGGTGGQSTYAGTFGGIGGPGPFGGGGQVASGAAGNAGTGPGAGGGGAGSAGNAAGGNGVAGIVIFEWVV